MYTAITVIHVLACLFMIGVVLLQQGKGADMGAVFGGSSQTLFGSSGAGNFLTRLTAGVATIFILTSLSLAYGSASRVTSTIFDDAPVAEPDASAPASEGAPAAQPAPQADAAAAAEGGSVAVVEPDTVVVEPDTVDVMAETVDADQAAESGAVVEVVEPDTAEVMAETAEESAENLAREAKEAQAAIAADAKAVAGEVKEGAQEAEKAAGEAAGAAEADAKAVAADVEAAAKDVQADAANTADKILEGEVNEVGDPVPQDPPAVP